MFSLLHFLFCVLALVAFRYLLAAYGRSPAYSSLGSPRSHLLIRRQAGPSIAALPWHRAHRFDFGDSGNLNYAWFVAGTEKLHLQQYQTNLFGAAEVHLIHPEMQLLKDPPVFSYKELPYGTYP